MHCEAKADGGVPATKYLLMMRSNDVLVKGRNVRILDEWFNEVIVSCQCREEGSYCLIKGILKKSKT